jgi:pseudouridine synthase
VTQPHHLVDCGPHLGGGSNAGNFFVTVGGKSLSVSERDLKTYLSRQNADAGGSVLPDSASRKRPASAPETATTATTATTRVWIAHKLSGELVADADPHDRPSLLQRLRRGGVGKDRGRNGRRRRGEVHHLKPIGRLDMTTEGLLLVTNDGRYAREMEWPGSRIHRTYRVRVHGRLDGRKVRRIQAGMTGEDGTRYAPMRVRIDPPSVGTATSTNKWLEVTCVEGKNRQIRKVFSYLGCTCVRVSRCCCGYCWTPILMRRLVYSSLKWFGRRVSPPKKQPVTVTRLIRIRYGDYTLDTIPPGLAIEVPVKPIESQRHKGPLFFSSSSSSSAAAARGTGRPQARTTTAAPPPHRRRPSSVRPSRREDPVTPTGRTREKRGR